MRPRPLVTLLLAPALVASLGTACASGKGKRAAVPPAEPAFLEVQNNFPSPVSVYAIADNGFRQRIASSVGSARPQRIKLPATLINAGGSLRIVAYPIADNGSASTGRITVRPGDVVQFTIATTLSASTVYIR